MDRIGVTLTKGFNPNFDICLEFGEKYENEFQKIIEGKKIEVKTDRIVNEALMYLLNMKVEVKKVVYLLLLPITGFIVYGQKFKKQTYVFIPTDRLKKIIKEENIKKLEVAIT